MLVRRKQQRLCKSALEVQRSAKKWTSCSVAKTASNLATWWPSCRASTFAVATPVTVTSWPLARRLLAQRSRVLWSRVVRKLRPEGAKMRRVQWRARFLLPTDLPNCGVISGWWLPRDWSVDFVAPNASVMYMSNGPNGSGQVIAFFLSPGNTCVHFLLLFLLSLFLSVIFSSTISEVY